VRVVVSCSAKRLRGDSALGQTTDAASEVDIQRYLDMIERESRAGSVQRLRDPRATFTKKTSLCSPVFPPIIKTKRLTSKYRGMTTSL